MSDVRERARLEATLITLDGKGREAKRAALDAILRAERAAVLREQADAIAKRDLVLVPMDSVHGIENRAAVAMWARGMFKDIAAELRAKSEEEQA